MSRFNFKNVITYKLPKIEFTVEELNHRLSAKAYHPLLGGQLSLTSFSAVATEGEGDLEIPVFAKAIQDNSLKDIGAYLTVNIANRNIPPKVIDDEYKRRLKAMEKSSGKKLHKAEKIALKEDVINSLADKGFPSEKTIDIIIDLRSAVVFVGTTSAATAEKCFAAIRKVIGTFNAVPIKFGEVAGAVFKQIFVDETVQGSDTKYYTSNKFKLCEFEQSSCSVTNNMTEYPLEALRELVKSNCLEVVQLEIYSAEISYSMLSSKQSAAIVQYKNINATASKAKIDEAKADDKSNHENEHFVAMEAFLWLEDLNRILKNSEVFFGGFAVPEK